MSGNHFVCPLSWILRNFCALALQQKNHFYFLSVQAHNNRSGDPALESF